MNKKEQRKQEEVKSALRVSEIISDRCKEKLLYDSWPVDLGLKFIVGIHELRLNDISDHIDDLVGMSPDEITEFEIESAEDIVFTLNEKYYSSKFQRHITDGFKSRLKAIRDIWNSGDHPNINSPKYYLEWAKAKKIEVYWDKWASDHGYLIIEKQKRDFTEDSVQRKKMLGTILVFAKEKYGYPSRGAMTTMCIDLDASGNIGVTENTLRNYLKEAEKLFPDYTKK